MTICEDMNDRMVASLRRDFESMEAACGRGAGSGPGEPSVVECQEPRPRLQIGIGTIMVAVAAAAVVGSLWSRSPAFAYGASIPASWCVVASHAYSRCRSEGRRPNRKDWEKAGMAAMLIAALIKFVALIVLLR